MLETDIVVKHHVQHTQVFRCGTPYGVVNICDVSDRSNSLIFWVKKYKKFVLCDAEHDVTATIRNVVFNFPFNTA